MKAAFSYIAFFLILLPELLAQYRFDNYKHLTVADGLPSDHVFEFAEDKYGFIWIATTNGLAKYDGSKIILLERLPSDSVFLPSNYIQALLIRGDSLWIGTDRGLTILNLNTRTFSNYLLKSGNIQVEDDHIDRNRLEDIYEDRQGNVWLTYQYEGFVKWDKKTQSFKYFNLSPSKKLPNAYRLASQTSLVQIIQDVKMDSIMWAASGAGLIKLNQETGEITRILYERGDENTQFNINRKICVFQDDDGIVYTGSWSAGLSIYNPLSGEYSYPSIKLWTSDNRNINFGDGHLYGIVDGKPGYLYFTSSDGFFLYDIQANALRLIKKSSFKGEEIDFGIDYIDTKNRIWFGSYRGIVVSDPIVHQFNWFSLAELNPTDIKVLPRGLVEDFYPGYLSISGQYTDGLYHINPSTGHMFKQVVTEHMQNHRYFQGWGLDRLDEQTLLVLSSEYLYQHHKGSNNLEPFRTQVPSEIAYLDNILVDDKGIAWLGSRYNGAYTIDLTKDIVKSYRDQAPSPLVNGQFQDDKGNIWMIMDDGHLVWDYSKDTLWVFDYTKDRRPTFFRSGNYCECPNGEVWLSGFGEGMGLLSRDEPERGIIQKVLIKDKQGSQFNMVRLACNRNNELWAVVTGGLIKIKREDWSYKYFSFEYGLKEFSGIFRFLKNGDLFIGSREGFYTVDPNELIINTSLPRPYVVSIVSNKGPKNKLEDYLKRIPVSLSPDENVMTVEFSSINHTLSERTRYLYMLEGVDEDWIDPGEKRAFTYSYLEGGKYVFKVKAANNEGIWNEDVYELPITVGTPWYKTTLFWFVLGILLLGFVFAYYKDRIRRIQKESKLKAAFEKRVADLEMSALRAQMNPHFIFNSLNSIDAYIIKNDTRKASEYLNNFSRLVRLILQNSRSSYVNLNDELESLELYIKLEQMRFRNSFSYEILLKDNLMPENYEIPPMLIQPFVENAIWHGLNYLDGGGGKVSIEISVQGDNLVCAIEDNGIGREASAKIRAAKKVKRKSMGMGITAERIDTINKIYHTNNQVEIVDLYNEDHVALGTRVILKIPL